MGKVSMAFLQPGQYQGPIERRSPAIQQEAQSRQSLECLLQNRAWSNNMDALHTWSGTSATEPMSYIQHQRMKRIPTGIRTFPVRTRLQIR